MAKYHNNQDISKHNKIGCTVDRKSLSALRGVGPEFEAGSGSFYARTLPDGALRVKCPAFLGAGRAPHPEMPGSARGWAENASPEGAPCRCWGCQFSANTGSWSGKGSSSQGSACPP